jgi:hypothetical protein
MSLREEFLMQVWKHQRFNTLNLKSTNAQSLEILMSGNQNQNAGPDFKEARVKIDDIEWVGNIEIHVKASDWNQHKHGSDSNYQNVILHVVWTADQRICLEDGSEIPTLELKSYIEDGLVSRYQSFIDSDFTIKCKAHLPNISGIVKFQMLEKALSARLENRAVLFKPLLETLKYDFEEFSYVVFMRFMGFSINGLAMETLAKSLPLKILLKHKSSQLELEALLYGQAGFLEKTNEDAYHALLSREYLFLKHKYRLAEPMLRTEWQFMRARPANFPTIRIAQVAAIIFNTSSFFSLFIDTKDLAPLKFVLDKTL